MQSSPSPLGCRPTAIPTIPSTSHMAPALWVGRTHSCGQGHLPAGQVAQSFVMHSSQESPGPSSWFAGKPWTKAAYLTGGWAPRAGAGPGSSRSTLLCSTHSCRRHSGPPCSLCKYSQSRIAGVERGKCDVHSKPLPYV